MLAAGQFRRIAALAQEHWGLHLTERKVPLVSSRLSSFLRHTAFDSIEEYLQRLENEPSEEDMLAFFDILSTNVTSFFRDRSHFDCLARELYAPLAGTSPSARPKLRLWSAACSTGQEPYSLALHALRHVPDIEKRDVRILGTDLSTWAVQAARRAQYPRQKVAQEVPPEYADAGFVDVDGEHCLVAPRARGLVRIARLNLTADWPFRGTFDAIFCRNVMIYFDTPTREKLVRRFHRLLVPDGLLAVGSAETLAGLDVPFAPVQASVYRKA